MSGPEPASDRKEAADFQCSDRQLEPLPALAELKDSVGSRRPFLSLKWKAMLFTSLLLLIIALAYTAVSYRSQTRQLETQSEILHQIELREFQAALDGSLRRLQAVAALIPTFAGMRAALLEGGEDSVSTALEDGWPGLQFEMDIDLAQIYGLDGTLISGWQSGAGPELNSNLLQRWVEDVIAQKRPVLALACPSGCKLYAVVPLLVERVDAGVALLGSSLAGVVLQYESIIKHDIAVLAPGQADQLGPESGVLPGWSERVVALTNRAVLFPLLKDLSRKVPLNDVNAHQTQIGGKIFQARLISMQGFEDRMRGVRIDPAARVLVFRDVTQAIAGIRQATRESLAVGIGGWILSELMLMLVLWRPMSRLRHLADKLPLLALRRFSSVRDAISPGRGLARTRDEIDVLDGTAIDLADQLEALETQVEDRNRALSRRMVELSAERDFVRRLLDTAQVMIITLDSDGYVVACNRFTTEQCGFREFELVGRRFIDLLSAKDMMPDLPERLLAVGRGNNLRHESILQCRDGSSRSVTWYHSPLAEGGGREANILSVGLDVTERKDAEHRLFWLDEHDPLTGLVNRHGFRKHLEEYVARYQSGEWEGALLVCDLDQFKLVNDAGGHHIGDAVLKTVAETLDDGIDGVQHLARLDSDQFAMLLNVDDSEAAAAVARLVNELLANVDWPSGVEPRRLRACCGIAMVSKQARTAADLLGQAEFALELAKETGGGRWHLFRESDRSLEHVRRNLFWQTQVESALENDRFVIYCQPILEIRTGRISHYEVLLRLRQDDGSVSTPAAFINAAERCGMIHLVDRRVTSLALEQLAALRESQDSLFFAINLSARALGDEDFLPHLQTELKRTGVEPARVIFEITETAAVADFSAARRLMGAIRNLGCRFALDDFGVGFSSFYYLKQLPIDFVKIDGSFINQLAESPDDQVLVRALRQVAAGFGKKTIAEYVEDKQTLELLAQFGIDYAQGYYVGRPELVKNLAADATSVKLG